MTTKEDKAADEQKLRVVEAIKLDIWWVLLLPFRCLGFSFELWLGGLSWEEEEGKKEGIEGIHLPFLTAPEGEGSCMLITLLPAPA